MAEKNKPSLADQQDDGDQPSRKKKEEQGFIAPPPAYEPPSKPDMANQPARQGNNNGWKLYVSLSITIIAMAVLAAYDLHSKYNEIDSVINKGSNPPLIVDHELVNRSDLVEEIISSFILAPKNEVRDIEPFGIIIGPTGTGKTQLIREACRQHPKGVLYAEIDSPDIFVEKLARAVGMKIRASFFTSFFIGKIFPQYIGYYELPEDDYPKAIAIVIESLLERALLFKEREGRPVSLFIDGADLLAKNKPKVFQKLVDTAKNHANSGSLRIVFGCGEESVLPIIDRTSSKTRIKVLEVGDLSDSKAIDYLKKHNVPDELATQVVEFAGGRMIFLHRSVMVYRTCIFKKITNYDNIYEEIIEDLKVLFGYAGIKALVKGGNITIDIMKYMKNRDAYGFYLHDYLKTLSPNVQSNKVEEVIESLVKANAFRYTDLRNKVTWHSRLMQKMAEKFFRGKLST